MNELISPYANLGDGQWWRGNLHAHSTNSDGTRSPQQVVNDYARHGYDFLMLSDHDYLTSAAELAGLKSHGLALIPGNEISREGPHLLHVDARTLVPAYPDRQRTIDRVRAEGGFVIVNHPNWFANFNHCDQRLMEEWQGYAGLEIYNGVIGRLPGSPYATNRWDMLLGQRRRLWGYAHDDSHVAGESGLGWNMVWAAEQTPAAIVAALAAGQFYASTGVVIRELSVRGRRLTIATENAERIVALRDTAKRIKVADAKKLTVEFPAGAIYVRFECWGRGESFAWSQPVFGPPAK